MSNHTFSRQSRDYMVCTQCGLALHNKLWKGFRYWFAGVGYKDDPNRDCLKEKSDE